MFWDMFNKSETQIIEDILGDANLLGEGRLVGFVTAVLVIVIVAIGVYPRGTGLNKTIL